MNRPAPAILLIIAATFLLLLAFAAPADGATRITGNLAEPEWYERQIKRSAVKTPNVTIKVEERRCRELRSTACAYPVQRRIVMPWTAYLWTDEARKDPGYDRSRWLDKTLFMHEVFHVLDLGIKRTKRAFRRYRRPITQALGYRAKRWHRWEHDKRLHEVGADAYAACAYWPRRRAPYGTGSNSLSWYGYAPTRREHRRICRVLAP